MRRLFKLLLFFSLLSLLLFTLYPQRHQSLLTALKSNNITLIKSEIKNVLREIRQDPLKYAEESRRYATSTQLSWTLLVSSPSVFLSSVVLSLMAFSPSNIFSSSYDPSPFSPIASPSPSPSSSSPSSSPSLPSPPSPLLPITPNHIDFGHGRLLLHVAAMHSNLSTITYLYHIGCHYDAILPLDGRTPLHIASIYNEASVVSLLISYGSEVNRRTLWGGWTPLMYSVLWSNHDITRTLLSHGAHVTLQWRTDDDKGRNAMQMAIVWSDARMVEILLEYGAYVDKGEPYWEDYVKYYNAYKGRNSELER